MVGDDEDHLRTRSHLGNLQASHALRDRGQAEAVLDGKRADELGAEQAVGARLGGLRRKEVLDVLDVLSKTAARRQGGVACLHLHDDRLDSAAAAATL